MISLLLCVAVAVSSCGVTTSESGQPAQDPDQSAPALPTAMDIVGYCASLGPKMPGSESSQQMAEAIAESFRRSGLDKRFDDFNLPQFKVNAVSLVVGTNPPAPVPAQTFSFGGIGSATGRILNLGIGRAVDYEGIDAKGAIVMVSRDPAFHRSSQYREAIAHGGAAMLYVSDSPDNLVQGGTARFAQDLPGTIPVVTVGSVDGSKIRDLVRGKPTTATMTVSATRINARGRNVIGSVRGTAYPDRYLVLGGHYDAWHDGAVDNCTGIASLMTVARSITARKPRYSVIFAGWDGEETGLTGSMNWLIRNPEIATRTVVNQNFEMTAAGPLDTSLVILTKAKVLRPILARAALKARYNAVYATTQTARKLAGGLIPTDMQNFYASNIQGFSTFTKSAFYHTTEDTTKHVSVRRLNKATAFMQYAFDGLQDTSPDQWRLAEVPQLTIETGDAKEGTPLTVIVTARSPSGTPIPDASINMVADQPGYWAVHQADAQAMGGGRYRFTVPGKVVKPGELTILARLNTADYSGFNAEVVRVE